MRRLHGFVVLILAGCARPVTAPTPPPRATTVAPPAPTQAAAHAVARASTEVPDDAQLEADLRLVVGGMFAPDHLGPEAYATIEARLAAHPAAYAEKAGELFGRSPPPPELPLLHTPALLARLHAGAPEETGVTAHAILLSLGALLPVLDRSSDARKQALAQMPMLEALAGGIDPPFDPAAQSMPIDRLCAVPTPSGHGLMVVNECTCGERPVCRAKLDGDRVSVSVRRDDSRAPHCLDCYASWSTCSLPRLLRPGQRVTVTLDGRAFGELTAGKTGALAPGVCLSRSP
jgi:hypothetical protein